MTIGCKCFWKNTPSCAPAPEGSVRIINRFGDDKPVCSDKFVNISKQKKKRRVKSGFKRGVSSRR